MREKKERRKFSNDFKEEACKLVKGQGQNISVTANNLGLSPAVLGRWMKDKALTGALQPQEKVTPEHQKIKALEQQVITPTSKMVRCYTGLNEKLNRP